MIPKDPAWIEVWVTTGAFMGLAAIITASVVLIIYTLATTFSEEN